MRLLSSLELMYYLFSLAAMEEVSEYLFRFPKFSPAIAAWYGVVSPYDGGKPIKSCSNSEPTALAADVEAIRLATLEI